MKNVCKFLTLVLLGFAAVVRVPAAESAVINEHKVNIRGQPSFIGEVVTQLERGDPVTILEIIEVEKPAPGEPSIWAKIKLPENTPVWVFGAYIKDGVVDATRLNIRAGPGENYSVLGRIEDGTRVKQIRALENWIEIEAPENAYAFVDASLLRREGEPARPPRKDPVISEAPATPPAVEQTPAAEQAAVAAAAAGAGAAVGAVEAAPREITTPPPGTEPVPPIQVAEATPSPETVEPQSVETPAEPPVAQPEEASPTTVAQAEPAAQPETPAQPEPLPEVAEPIPAQEEAGLPRRVVRREGIVRSTRSIQAPTWYELIHPETKRTINYLHEERLGVNLGQYKGFRVIVSGEEAVDSRWPGTPILELQSIEAAR